MTLNGYSTVVFDCDGVVLDSNRVKTEAFRATAEPWGETAADALVAYHIAHGGISRYAKLSHFVEHILPEHATGEKKPVLEDLLARYGQEVRAGLLNCAVAECLETLRAATPDTRWLIVSGGDQAELREIFELRGLSHYFDGGIFGSPDTKDTILARELAAGTIELPAIFLGDSRYDFLAASRAGLEFCFLHAWTEFTGWPQFIKENGIPGVSRLADLLMLPIQIR